MNFVFVFVSLSSLPVSLTLSVHAFFFFHFPPSLFPSKYRFFDILINLLGFSLPFSLCLTENFPALAMAVLGFIPPVLATSVAVAYICL